MGTKDLRRLCDAAETQARRRRSAESPAFVLPVWQRTSGSAVGLVAQVEDPAVDAPVLWGEVETAGDAEEQATGVRFDCAAVRAFLADVHALAGTDVALQIG